jgi:futalosine hydrolase
MPRHLILVPTEMERRILAPILSPVMAQGCRVALCGFGPVAAAARTAQLLAEHAPERVLLVGIAGRLDDRLAVGAAYEFERVACYGVGAGSGGEFVPAAAMGWQQWPGDADGMSPHGGDPIGDEIGDLMSRTAGRDDGGGRAGLLLTVCAAAASDEDVRLRKQAFPAVMAEAVAAREDLHPTALENGVALLHPRRPQTSILAEPLVLSAAPRPSAHRAER